MTTEHQEDKHEEGSSNFVFFSVVGTIFVIAIIILFLWMQNFSIKVTTGGGFSLGEGKRVKLPPAVVHAQEEAPTENVAAEAIEESEESSESGGTSSSAVDMDMDMVSAAIQKGGCIACHTIPDIDGAVGQIGPELSNIGADAATRIDGYTAHEYIRESLMDPNAFTAPDCPTGPCPPGLMPDITLTLDLDEIDTVLGYLVTLGAE